MRRFVLPAGDEERAFSDIKRRDDFQPEIWLIAGIGWWVINMAFYLPLTVNRLFAADAITRDYFRLILLTGQDDVSIDEVEDRAEAIRQAMLDDHQTECIIFMQPIGGIPAFRTEEGRYAFEINFQTIISR